MDHSRFRSDRSETTCVIQNRTREICSSVCFHSTQRARFLTLPSDSSMKYPPQATPQLLWGRTEMGEIGSPKKTGEHPILLLVSGGELLLLSGPQTAH